MIPPFSALLLRILTVPFIPPFPVLRISQRSGFLLAVATADDSSRRNSLLRLRRLGDILAGVDPAAIPGALKRHAVQLQCALGLIAPQFRPLMPVARVDVLESDGDGGNDNAEAQDEEQGEEVVILVLLGGRNALLAALPL